MAFMIPGILDYGARWILGLWECIRGVYGITDYAILQHRERIKDKCIFPNSLVTEGSAFHLYDRIEGQVQDCNASACWLYIPKVRDVNFIHGNKIRIVL